MEEKLNLTQEKKTTQKQNGKDTQKAKVNLKKTKTIGELQEPLV